MISSLKRFRGPSIAGLLFVIAAASAARAVLPPWLQHVVSASSIESALYRSMQPGALKALYPRPPKEAQSELARLIASTPDQAELYELRARIDEQSLDETAAEADWKLYAARSKDTVAAKLALADFYQRRLLIPQAIAVLREVAAAPSPPSETYLDPLRQRSWQAYERVLGLCVDQALPAEQTRETFDAFLSRYPSEPAVYAHALAWLIEQKDYAAAEQLIARYQRTLPGDGVFAIRARAAVAFARGNAEAALAVYDRAFQPLWPASLIQAYFTLLEQTHRERAFVAAARAQLAAHPDGPEALNALARVFYYDQQAGRTQAAQQTLDAFRIAREARNGAWPPNDLATLAALALSANSYAEAARYDYALASSAGSLPDGEPAAQAGLAGLIHILLEANATADSSGAQLALGAQNLSLYRDIATLDQGPGYWNGILSLWLNGTSPQSEYAAEGSKAQAYFHRAKAAELLADLDKRFPNAPQRAALHAELIHAIAQYGEPAVVVAAGKEFLAAFPKAPERLDVAEALADAYAQQNDTASEFALYEAQLRELAAASNGQPLTAAAPVPASDGEAAVSVNAKALALAAPPVRRSLPQATAYARILDRYLGRLTAAGQLPRALSVLRAQLDQNPEDPLLYERLATFLQQNNLSAEQERLFEQAIAHFQQPTYYDKLARLYLREQKRQAYATLTRQVTGIFSGSDLDAYFATVDNHKAIGAQLALQLNLYAANRFPHDLVFTHNLLAAYQDKVTHDPAAYESLLRRVWFEAPELQTEFLTYLSRTGKIESELAALNAAQPASENPATLREAAEIDLFTSHFEQAAPMLSALAELYPADPDIGDSAVSLFRSLAYNDPTRASTARAVSLETKLLQAEPDSPDRLATLGDLYAEATATGGEDLAAAAPYWHRIAALHPGSAQGFLASATIFWDYFQFHDSLAAISAARTRFHSPALFAYEAGALAESRRDLAAAVAEYTSAVVDPAEAHPLDAPTQVDALFKPPSDAADSNLWSAARSFVGSPEANARLIVLATRPSTAGLVDAATSRAVAEHPVDSVALTLRASILVAQHHATALTALFEEALARAATADEAASIAALTQARNLIPLYEQALAKEAALSLDPVQKIELQFTLARSLEAHKDLAGAARVIDAVYQANPRILGVVRATTDFYARSGQPARAIRTLLDAAQAATPELARSFTLEAASRANDANDTAQARTLATNLLAQTPYDARVLSLIATSYARSHDDAGLKAFFLSQLDHANRDAGLTPEARRQDIALLRRGLIPALTRLNDFNGATAQYLALLSAYPEDAGTAQQAALYALQHGRQAQLLDFLRTAMQQSPRDSRFPILLAQTEITFEDLPAAKSAYDAAIALRKDRVDLYIARVNLELHLNEFEPVAADFERLYLLSYHDPAWMVRLAELRARQKRPAEAVKALETAYITGHPVAAADSFKVAAQLAEWNLLTEARTFAERGVALAGPELFTPHASATYPQPPSNAATYATILTRLGHADTALAALVDARRQAELSATSPAVLAAELSRENISQDEAADFRKNFAMRHRQAAETELKLAVNAIAAAVRTYDTPEQKLAYARTLDALHAANPQLALAAATAAGLTDREADWRRQLLLTGDLREAPATVQPYIALQQRRLAFPELAGTLEAYAARLKPEARATLRRQAATAWRDAGDLPNELRVERSLTLANDPTLQARFFDLLLDHDPQALAAFAADSNPTLADAALNYTIAHASQAQALAAVAARGKTLPPVWRPASASLVETYFANPESPASLADFNQSLRPDATVGERIGHPANPAVQLTGDLFFAYASRLGIVLLTALPSPAQPAAEDFLPAALERSPSSSASYLDLARTYVEANNTPAALAEYGHALELAPADVGLHDELATVLFRAGRREEALATWHDALTQLLQMQQRASYPESFFTGFETIARHLGERHLFAVFRPEIEAIVGPYLAHNGSYRSNELLRAVYSASGTPREGIDLILTLANYAPQPKAVLEDLSGASWLAPQAGEPLLLRRLELERNATDPSSYAIDNALHALLTLYLDQGEDTRAQALLDTIPTAQNSDPAFAGARILIAARSGHLDALLAALTAAPESAPANDTLSQAADTLARQAKPDPKSARSLREYVFNRKQLTHTLIPTDFLALAQSRIETGDLPGALTLLRRLNLYLPNPDTQAADPGFQLTADPYANPDSAAALLEAAHQPAEAIAFLEQLTASVPWNANYRLRLAQAQLAANRKDQAIAGLTALARDPSAAYELRAQAARSLASSSPPDLGSGELTLIAHPDAQAARQPYFALARLAAAQPGVAARDSLLREAIAIAPDGMDAGHARLSLLLAQPSTANASATLAILNGTETLSFAENPDDEAGASRGAANLSPDAVQVATAILPPLAATLDLPIRVRLATMLAAANQRDGNLLNALAYAQLAVTLSGDRPDLMHLRYDLKREILLARRNAARRPRLQAELSASIQVRPRLTAQNLDRELTP